MLNINLVLILMLMVIPQISGFLTASSHVQCLLPLILVTGLTLASSQALCLFALTSSARRASPTSLPRSTPPSVLVAGPPRWNSSPSSIIWNASCASASFSPWHGARVVEPPSVSIASWRAESTSKGMLKRCQCEREFLSLAWCEAYRTTVCIDCFLEGREYVDRDA